MGPEFFIDFFGWALKNTVKIVGLEFFSAKIISTPKTPVINVDRSLMNSQTRDLFYFYDKIFK